VNAARPLTVSFLFRPYRFLWASRPQTNPRVCRRRRIIAPHDRSSLFTRFWLLLGIFAVLTGVCVPARGQVIQTIAGGVNPSNSPSENACPPFTSTAPHGTDIYVTNCEQIFKVDALGRWTHVAGSGIVGFSSDGTPAATANYDGIASLSLDSSGNIYFNETFSNRVREIVASTGLIKTVAGTGTSGYSGDGGPATGAQISGGFSMGVFADTNGNVFIGDLFNHRVRKVASATGIITTVAGNGTKGFSGDGGPATSALVSNPRGVFVDATGNLFISDVGNNRIREVLAATGIIQTIAGNGTSGFSGDGGPATSAEISVVQSVAVDASGNLFMADLDNNRIREVVAATGKIQTVAGNGGGFLSGCNGGVNACIGVGRPATNALVPFPIQVAVDSSGNIYMAVQTATRNLIEQVVGSTGNLQIFAANGAQDFTGTNGPAIKAQLNVPNFAVTDGAGNVFIADANNNVIYEIVAATGILKIVAGTGVSGYAGDGRLAINAELAQPYSVVVDGSGNLFIADTDNSVIREVVAATGMIETVAGNASAACNLTFGDGGPATSASLCFPFFAALDSQGNIFIADDGYSLIREVVASTSNIQTVAGSGGGIGFGYSGDGGPATSALLNGPGGVFVDSAGNLFIADTLNNVIREVAAATGIITTVAGNTSGTAGFSGDGGPAVGAEMNEPETVWGDDSGNFYVSDFFNNAIRKFTLGGNIQTIAGSRVTGFAGDGGPATSAEMDGPDGAFVEPSGSVLIADIHNGRVRIVGSPTTTTLTTSVNPSVVGQNVTIQATVSAPGKIPPVGSVTILDNGSPLVTLGVSSGVPSTVVTNTLAVGYHLLTAQFFGTNFPGSVSSQLNQQVVNVGPNPPQGTPPTGPGALSSGAGSFNFGWPAGCIPAIDGTAGNCSHTYGLTYPSNMFQTGDIVTITPTETSQADWVLRTSGNGFAPSHLAEVLGYGGDGFIFSASCMRGASPCTFPPNNYYTTTSAWHSPDAPGTWCTFGAGKNNPQLLKADPIGSNNWIGILIACEDGGPKHIGGSGPTLSDWANVKGATGTAPTITITTPANGANYNQNSIVDANYSCGPTPPVITGDCFGGPDLVNGTTIVQNGTPIDTSTLGAHSFQVAADVSSGPGGSMPVVPPPVGFTNVLFPQTVTYTVVAGPQASATPASVNFGTFHVPGFGFQFVTVKNTGTAPLSISRVRVTSVADKDSDDFFAFSLCPKTLGAGKSCFILVSFFADEVTANNPQLANLTITVNATGGSLVVPLSATVVKR
jgi:Big-like domain-containing protein